MRHFLLCDDDSSALVQLENTLRARYGSDELSIASFTCADDALDYCLDNEDQLPAIDAAILDIVMPDMQGTQLAMQMRAGGFSGAILFLTTSRQYAPESYAAGALDYVLKPYSKQRLTASLDKLDAWLDERDDAALVLPISGTGRLVLLRDILYIEAGNHVTHFFLCGGEELRARGSLSSWAPSLLADDRFAACHSSFVVNMSCILRLDGQDIILKDAQRLPIARRYAGFKKEYMNWLMQRGRE
jgi:DNA-binding LytR/AlgR family response regulator